MHATGGIKKTRSSKKTQDKLKSTLTQKIKLLPVDLFLKSMKDVTKDDDKSNVNERTYTPSRNDSIMQLNCSGVTFDGNPNNTSRFQWRCAGKVVGVYLNNKCIAREIYFDEHCEIGNTGLSIDYELVWDTRISSEKDILFVNEIYIEKSPNNINNNIIIL